MLGIQDFTISLVYLLCIASALLCVVYGIINWNKGQDNDPEDDKEIAWENEEKKVEENL